MQLRYAVLGCLALITGIVWWYFAPFTPATVTIYDDRFEPTEVTIRHGETVRFVSAASRDVWPASDAHPSHYLYPEFDPQRPLLPGETWEFTFEYPGTWEFHDHLLSNIGGTITVIGEVEFGMAARNCVSVTSGVSRAACWQKDFEQLIAMQGLDAGFQKFVEFYATEPQFKDYCHDIMHYVGRAAYEVYTLDQSIIDRQETSFCGFGFYHGFIEASLEATGNGGMDVATAYCESIYQADENKSGEQSYTAGACWHGIGHAVFDSLPGTLWGNAVAMTEAGIAICESVFNTEHRRWQCSTGIYNSLANALVNHSYNLALNPNDAVPICSTQKAVYQDACYLDMAVVWANSNRLTLEEGIAYALTFPEESHRANSIKGIIDDTLRRGTENVPTIAEVVAVCEKLNYSLYKTNCLKGLITAVAFGSHGENMQERLINICPYFTDVDLLVACDERVASIMLQLL